MVETDDGRHSRQRLELREEVAARVGVAVGLLEGEVRVEELPVKACGGDAAVVEDGREEEVGPFFSSRERERPHAAAMKATRLPCWTTWVPTRSRASERARTTSLRSIRSRSEPVGPRGESSPGAALIIDSSKTLPRRGAGTLRFVDRTESVRRSYSAGERRGGPVNDGSDPFPGRNPIRRSVSYEGGQNGGGLLKLAIVGTGISGLSAAWRLHGRHDVRVFEREGRPGGHSHTVESTTGAGKCPSTRAFSSTTR